jgi:hypothetical protein
MYLNGVVVTKSQTYLPLYIYQTKMQIYSTESQMRKFLVPYFLSDDGLSCKHFDELYENENKESVSTTNVNF